MDTSGGILMGRNNQYSVVGVDPASDDGDTTVAFLVDKDTLLDIYWSLIPEDKKKKIPIGESHDKNKLLPRLP